MTVKAVIGKIHLYLGLLLGAWFVLVCVSGSIIVFEEELDRLLHPEFFELGGDEGNSARRPAMPLSRVLVEVRQAYPDLTPQRIIFRHAPNGPYLIWLHDPADEAWLTPRYEVAFDQYAGKSIGLRSGANPVRLIWQFHIDLLMGEVGKTILGVSAVLLLVSCLTGLVLWWPRRTKVRQAFAIKRGARGHRLNMDLHRVTGIYLLLPLAIATFTGIVIIWPQYTFPVLEAFLDIPERRVPEQRTVNARWRADIDGLKVRVRELLPNGQLAWVAIPSEDRPFYHFSVRSFSNGHPRGRSYARFYADNGALHSHASTYRSTLGYQIRWEWLVPTHSGDILGVPGKIAMLLAGLSPVVFIATGLVIWRNKRKAWRHRQAKTRTHPATARGERTAIE